MAIRNQIPLQNERLEALRLLTLEVVRHRGKVTEQALEGFCRAGWESQQVLEIVLGVAIKTMSNYTNALVDVPLDSIVESEA